MLTDFHVAEANARQCEHLVTDGWHGFKQNGGFFHGHVEHVGDAFVAIFHLQRFAAITLAFADIAGDVNVGQKVHFNLDDAIALAGFAASALDVERETPRCIAARFSVWQSSKPFADRRKRARIGGWIRAWCAANGRLVNIDDLVEMFKTVDALMRCGMLGSAIQFAGHGFVERVNDQCGFSAA